MRPAHAKVNLWLNVVGRRADGYHLLDSLVAFADLADALEVAPSDSLTLTVRGPWAAHLESESDNLVLKAARLLAERAGVAPRAALGLTKTIPVAAGLGGGSADAAAALRALAAMWRIAVPEQSLFSLAEQLGADVPMCFGGRTAIASGVGERLGPAPSLPDCGLLLVNPGVPVATAEVFAARQGPFSRAQVVEGVWGDLAALVAALAARGNDLQAPAIRLRPAIGEVLSFLARSDGVRYVAMSGSGATCFALYDSIAAAQQVALEVPGGWWRHAGRFVSG